MREINSRHTFHSNLTEFNIIIHLISEGIYLNKYTTINIFKYIFHNQ